MDRLRAITIFIAVAEAGSMSAAARRLGEPLANISRILAQLEEHIGATLIDRTTRRMAITDAGRIYLETCRRVIDALDGAESDIKGQSAELAGEIAVTAPVGFGRLHVMPVLTEFLAAYPQMNARVLLMDRVVDLMDEEIDVAVRIGQLADSTLMAKRIGSVRMITCAAPDYLARHGSPAAITELSTRDCVTFAGLPNGLRWIFKSARHGRKAVRVHSRMSVNSADAAIVAATSGIGITRLLSYQAEAALQSGSLKPLLERFDDTAIPVHLVYRPTYADNPRVREFVRFAAERLRLQKSLR